MIYNGDPLPIKRNEPSVENSKKPVVVLQTPCYRLEMGQDVKLSDEQQTEWEATLKFATVFQIRLHRMGFNSQKPQGIPTSLDEGSFKSLRKSYTENIQPLVQSFDRLFDRDKNDRFLIPLQTIKRQADEVFDRERKADTKTEQQRVIRIASDSDRDTMLEALRTFRHDINNASTVSNYFQLVDKSNEKIAELQALLVRGEGSDTTEGEIRIKKRRREETINTIPLQFIKMDNYLQTGLPFYDPAKDASRQQSLSPTAAISSPRESSQETSQYPPQDVSIVSLISMMQQGIRMQPTLQVSVGLEGYKKELDGFPPVRWNTGLAERFITNIIDNVRKGYEAKHTDPSERKVDIDMRVDFAKGQLMIVFRDRGIGYKPDMLTKWDNPQLRETAETGFGEDAEGKKIESHGVGFFGHTRLLENQFGGKVSIANRDGGGAQTTLIIPLSE